MVKRCIGCKVRWSTNSMPSIRKSLEVQRQESAKSTQMGTCVYTMCLPQNLDGTTSLKCKIFFKVFMSFSVSWAIHSYMIEKSVGECLIFLWRLCPISGFKCPWNWNHGTQILQCHSETVHPCRRCTQECKFQGPTPSAYSDLPESGVSTLGNNLCLQPLDKHTYCKWQMAAQYPLRK